jgi:hypothetical protein
LPDKAKADNKAAASLLPPPVIPTTIATPTMPLHDSTNANGNGNGNGSLSARFDSSSTRSSSAAPSPIIPSTPIKAVASADKEVEVVVEAEVEGEEGGEEIISFEEAVKRREAKELEQATLMCSLENKDACVMCSG